MFGDVSPDRFGKQTQPKYMDVSKLGPLISSHVITPIDHFKKIIVFYAGSLFLSHLPTYVRCYLKK